MKKLIYTLLMMLLTSIVSFLVYLSVLTLLARYRVIPLHHLDWSLGLAMSDTAYLTVLSIGVLIGYFMAKKWWQIIYVDGVYYFDRSKIRDARKIVTNTRIPRGKNSLTK